MRVKESERQREKERQKERKRERERRGREVGDERTHTHTFIKLGCKHEGYSIQRVY